MRIKLRSPAGTQVLTLATDATVATLLEEIRKETSISGPEISIKYGYPPKPLRLKDYASSTPLSELPVKLQGEQLIISGPEGAGSLRGTGAGVVQSSSGNSRAEETKTGGGGVYTPPSGTNSSSTGKLGAPTPFSFSGDGSSSSSKPSAPLSLSRRAPKFNKDDPPDVPLSSGRGTVVLRVMEDDNSCLFRALSYVMTRSMMSVDELRQMVAGTIQSAPDMYSEAVLEQKPDAYCEWIKMESSWGGGIELGILADFFDMEICTIDVATTNMIRFNEGKPRRAIVVYSGIHYDALALSPAGSAVHDSSNDEVVFDKDDQEVLMAAQELCRKLKQKKYFTDTQNFDLRCNVCKVGLKGERAAVEHAKSTGHQDFGEYSA